jgi:hypothetical protein
MCQTDPALDVVRAHHDWLFWKNNKSVDKLQHLSPPRYKGLHLQGQVGLLAGRQRYAIMASEIYMPGGNKKLAKISNIGTIMSYQGRHYWGG